MSSALGGPRHIISTSITPHSPIQAKTLSRHRSAIAMVVSSYLETTMGVFVGELSGYEVEGNTGKR
jgi:hypothetical protein